ncbi:AraC family transcriptional regulator [uncultured Pseudoteredinibacter sp.]|uniref:AraC family transcriptional regulator n=1 Tax=uncultured Pseudoteredinibacter sp. TaxID=1641701 RepID=UPI00261FD379|nr:AraC family transcriptional regulator [uncultured Pseudoteredinibacter sp.]
MSNDVVGLNQRTETSYIRMLVRGFETLGIDWRSLYESVGVSPEDILTEGGIIDHGQTVRFWEKLSSVVDDDLVGLRVAETVEPKAFGVVCYLLLSCETFGEGLRRFISYQELHWTALQVRVQEVGNYVDIYWDVSREDTPHQVECKVLIFFKLFNWVVDGELLPQHVSFSHSCRGGGDEYRRLFGCDVKFSQAGNRIRIPASSMDLPSEHANFQLSVVHEQLARQQMDELLEHELVRTLRRFIEQNLELGEADVNAAADYLHVSVRTLQRRLANAGTSFHVILDGVRRRLAVSYLRATDVSVTEIAHLLGFTEASTFDRAFKRWMGQPPGEFRREYRQDRLS